MALEKHLTVTLFFLWSCFSDTCLGQNHQQIGSCIFIVQPVCPDPSVNFFLYTRANQFVPQIVTVENITSSNFRKNRPNKFIMHGFNSNMHLDILQRMKNEYLMKDDLNVWMIDYSGVSAGPTQCYLAAVYNLPSVGKCAAEVVRKITESARVDDPDQVMHLVAFSLGAHLAGQVAEQLKPAVLPRITGLDPALPLFYTSFLNRKLSQSDAQLVDVIHTNALVQGQLQPCGHIDFYVNGGIMQPACRNTLDPIACDHHMAPTYFAESIRSQAGFWSWPCPSSYDYLSGKCPAKGDHQLMGEYVNKSSRGHYALNTNKESPYAMGDWK